MITGQHLLSQIKEGMFDLKDKIALVTGAAQGLGKGISLTLAGAGANIIINDLRADKRTDDLLTAIKKLGRNAAVIEADVSDEQAVKALFRKSKRCHWYIQDKVEQTLK